MSITLIGTLGQDPELRFTPNGVAVASFSLAVTPRIKADDGTWGDGPTEWFRVSAWRSLAENVCESLTKGSRVVVVANKPPEKREFTKRDGTAGVSIEVTADEVAPSLKWASVRVSKTERSKGATADLWATQAPTTQAPF